MSNIRNKKKKEKKNVHGMARVHGRTNSVALHSFFVKAKQSVGLFSPLLSNFQKKKNNPNIWKFGKTTARSIPAWSPTAVLTAPAPA